MTKKTRKKIKSKEKPKKNKKKGRGINWKKVGVVSLVIILLLVLFGSLAIYFEWLGSEGQTNKTVGEVIVNVVK